MNSDVALVTATAAAIPVPNAVVWLSTEAGITDPGLTNADGYYLAVSGVLAAFRAWWNGGR